MNTLDNTLEIFGRAEPDATAVQDAQHKLEATIAKAAARKGHRKTHAGGWLAAAASAMAAVAAFIWLPLTPTPALAFSDVQKHFRDFNTLRFEVEQRLNGRMVMKSRVSLLADGSVRAEVGDDVVVIANTREKRVLTLLKPSRMAMVSPLDKPGTRDEAMAWLDEVRDFQGMARQLPGSRTIRGERAHGWELPMQQGKMILWANDAGLPLEMQLDQAAAIELSFHFDFEPRLAPELFATAVPAGYNLAPTED
jgi:hypothetical protein